MVTAPPPTDVSVRKEARMRPLVLVLVSIGCGLGALYLVRAALVDIGGFRIDPSTAFAQFGRLLGDWRFWGGAVLLVAVMTISLELYGSEELSKVVPLYSMSYVIIALVGQLFLHEDVSPTRWLGVFAIVAGVVVLQRS
jgi:drug/metabolite transporter (DMT)-like permease